MSKFNEFMDTNPRPIIPDDMDGFFEYAKKRYREFDNVNGTHGFDDENEMDDEVERYIGDAMESLYLYQEYLEEIK